MRPTGRDSAALWRRVLDGRALDCSCFMRSDLYSSRNHVLAAIALLVAVATAADHHSTNVYDLNRQTLESVLAKWRIPCLLHKDWLDCSLLFVEHFKPKLYLTYPSSLKVPTYPPTHSLGYPTCTYPKICTVTTPIRYNEIPLLPTILRQLYYKTLLGSTTSIPQTITETPFPSNKHTDNLKFLYLSQLRKYYLLNPKYHRIQKIDREDLTETPIMAAADVKLKTVSNSVDDQSPLVTHTVQIPALIDINESEEYKTPPTYVEVPTVPLENEYELATTEVISINDSKSEVSDTTVERKADGVNELPKDDTVPELEIQTGSRRNLLMECEEKYARGPSTSDNTTSSNDIEEEITLRTQNKTSFDVFKETLKRLERKFLLSSYTKLTAISPEERKMNGISFIQSGLFLHMLLIALTTEVDPIATQEIEDCLELCASNEDRIAMLKHVISWLPESSESLKFRWSSRLVVNQALNPSTEFRTGAAAAMNLTVSQMATDDPGVMTKTLNDMIEKDSGGTMHDTFEEEEVSHGLCGVALSTVYVRARWRAAPTLLNGTGAFRDGGPERTTRFFRVNDRVRYAHHPRWDAEAIDIPYATPGLSLLVVVPKQPSLGALVARVAREGLDPLLAASRELRAAITLPLYTLRMTLLLPNKLQLMGMPSIVDVNNTDCRSLKLTHAVQRLMFWAEAGRNAYKDDGIEWDPRPEIEVTVDRPYLFFVRWHNVTLLNGNFVL